MPLFRRRAGGVRPDLAGSFVTLIAAVASATSGATAAAASSPEAGSASRTGTLSRSRKGWLSPTYPSVISVPAFWGSHAGQGDASRQPTRIPATWTCCSSAPPE
jgi:hypothetical protein